MALQVVAYNRTTSKVDDFLNNEVSEVAKSEAVLKVKCFRQRVQMWLAPTRWRRWWGS